MKRLLAVALALSLLAPASVASADPAALPLVPHPDAPILPAAVRRVTGTTLLLTGIGGVLAGVVLAGFSTSCQSGNTFYAIANGAHPASSSCLVPNDQLLTGGLVMSILSSGVLLTGIVLRIETRPRGARASR
jgi:hypothetical protein